MNRKRKIKRIVGSILCLLTLLFYGSTALADVIITPDDDFYQKHWEKCTTEARSYTGNGTEGYVILKESPISGKIVGTLANGEDYFITVVYQTSDGTKWGAPNLQEKTGWVRMEDMVLVYDNISFLEEHSSQIQDYQGEFDTYEFKKDPVILWSYPESGVINAEIPKRDDMVQFSSVYTDPEGSQWGYISYYYHIEGWVKFDDPTNRELPVKKMDAQVTLVPASPAPDLKDLVTANERGQILLLVGLIVLLVVGTGILIGIYWKKGSPK